MEVLITPIKNEHAEAIVDIILPIQQIEFNVPITLQDQPDLLDIENFYYKSGGCFWGAKINGELVGTIALIRYDGKYGAIRKMFVKKEFRGKERGIAVRLLEGLIQYAKDNGITDLHLGTVAVLKAALRFYERSGFIQIEKATLPEKFPLVAVDTEFFHLNLQ